MALKVTVDGTEFDVVVGQAVKLTYGIPGIPAARWRQFVALADEGGQVALGELFLDRRGDCVAANTHADLLPDGSRRTLRPGSIRDLIREWLRATELRQCYECGTFASAEHGDTFEGWTKRTVDLDPGDPEVGPQPCVTDVDVCPRCKADVDSTFRARCRS